MPAEIEIIEALPQASGCVYFRFKSTVRKKTMDFSCWYFPWSDGKWHLGKEGLQEWQNLRDNFMVTGGESATEAFARETLSALDENMLPWFIVNQDKIDAKAKETLEEKIEVVKQQIVDAEAALASWKANLADLERTYDEKYHTLFWSKPKFK